MYYLSHMMTEKEIKARKFGLPEAKKYPMPDADHVKSAIKFFNYVDNKHEKELAEAILTRINDLGIDPDSLNVGDKNRFKKYLDETYLKHYGVLGMKWGVRRYQNSDGSLTVAGKKRYSSNENIAIDTSSDNTSKKTGFHLTDKQKKALIVGVGVAGALLAAYGAYRLINANDVTKSLLYDKDTGLLKKLIPATSEQDIMSTNPNANSIFSGEYLTNCSKCSCSYDLRRRGFDVQAPKGTPLTQDIIDKYYDGAIKRSVTPGDFMGRKIPAVSVTDPDSYIDAFTRMCDAAKAHPVEFEMAQQKQAESLVKACESFGPKARGHISMYFTSGTGHSIAFENDASGTVRFIDSQIAHLTSNYGGGSDSAYFVNNIATQLNPFVQTDITRTDLATPNFDFLRSENIIQNAYDPTKIANMSINTMGLGAATTLGSYSYLKEQERKEYQKEKAKS